MENDWLLLNIENPNYDPGDFHTLGVDTNNTQFLSKEDYKNKKFVQDNFKDENGNFDDESFDKYYSHLAYGFSVLDSSEHLMEYDPFDSLRKFPGKQEKDSFNIYRVSNPTGYKIGAAGINEVSESPFSQREWAEKQKVVDSATGEEFDYSPNEHALFVNPKEWFLDQFKDPLVLAIYDQDGEHEDPISKQIVKHKKGEVKLNKEGKPYWETLNGRSFHGRQMLSSSDVYTVDGEGLNKYDFFDSDDVEKSIGGIIEKTAWSIAPLITPIAPYYAGIIAAREILKALPMLDGVFGAITGNNEDTAFTQFSNTIAGKMTQWTGSQSDYANQNTVSIEGLANLLSDVALQWSQQKLITQAFAKIKGIGSQEAILAKATQQAEKTFNKESSRILGLMKEEEKRALGLAATEAEKATISAQFAEKAKMFVGTPETWKDTFLGQSLIAKSSEQLVKSADKLYKLGANISLAHMAIVSNTDVYDSMLEHGATKREATIIALASTLGMFAVDKWLGLDKIFIDNISTENRILLRRAFTEEAKLMQNEFTNIFKNPNLSKAEKIQQLFAKGKELGRKASNTFFADIKDHTASGLKKAIAEGVEEVNEELVSDLSKQLYQLAGELGADTSVNNVEAFDNWDLKKLFSRYGMNFLGGFLGGSIFYGVEQFNTRPSVKDSDHASIIYASRNMKTQDMLNYLEKMWKQGRLGSTSLSATPMTNDDGTIYLDESGKRVYNTAKKGEDTINDFIYKRLREEIMQIDGIIRQYGDNLSEDDLFKLETYNEPRFQALEKYLKGAAYTTKYFELYQDILTKFVDTEVKLKSLKAPDQKTSPEYAKYEEEYNRLNQLKTLYRQQLDDFKSGKASINFLRMMLMHLDPRINLSYTKSSFEHWLSAEKGIKNINSLNNEEYEYYKKEYLENVKPFQKDDLQQKYQEFLHLEKDILPELMQIQEQMKDFKKWHEEVQKLFTSKSPFALRAEFNEDSLLPGEDQNSESYINRNTQLEGESTEEFVQRKNLRMQQISTLQKQEDQRVINEALAILRNAGFIDSATKRRLLSMIRSNKKQIITNKTNDIKNKWKDYVDLILNDDFSNVDDLVSQIERQVRKETYQSSEQRASERRRVLNRVPDLADRIKSIAGGDSTLQYLDALTMLANDGIITQREFVDLSTALDEDTSGNLEEALNTIHIGVNGEYKASDTDYDPDFGESPIYTGGIKAIEDYIDSIKQNAKNDIDFAINEIKDDPYYNFLNEVQNIPEAKNPIIEIVKKLALGLNRSYKDTESLLQTLYERASSGENSEFRLTESEQSAMDEAQDLLNKALGYIYAAKRQSDAVNPFQHNVVVNEIAKKHKVENWQELPVLDEDVSDLYQKEIIDYMREIGVWENNDWNVGSWKYWDSNSTKNRIAKFFNTSKNYTKIRIEWLEANKDKFKGDDFDLFEGIDVIPNTGDEIYLHKLEDLFYNNVQKALQKYNDFGEILAKTKFQESLNELELQEQNTSELNERMSIDQFTSMDKAMYILSIAALSSTDFNNTYKEIIEKGNIAPLITQKVADRTACALIHDLRNDNKIWKSGISKFHLWSGSKALLFENMVSLFGDGGAGKTVGCIKVIREFIGGNKEDVWIVAPGENQLQNLQDLNTEIYTADELSEKLISKYTSEEQEVEGNFTTQVIKDVNTEVKNFPKVIIIDESTHIDSTTLQAIHKLANEHNIAIIGVGDDIQNGYEEINDNKIVSNIGDPNIVFCGRTSRLGITLRDANLQKSENNFRISRIINALMRIPAREAKVERERKQKEQFEALNELTLQYFIGDTVNGDLIVPTLTQEVLDAIPESTKDKGYIAFVGTSNSNSYQKLKAKFGDKLELLDSQKKIQGKEFDFVIVDQEWNLENPANTEERVLYTVDFLKQLYTMATRSRQATIYIDNGLSNIIKNQKTEHKGVIKTFTPEIIDDFKKQELSVIESLKLQKTEPSEDKSLTLVDKINDLIDRMNSTTDLKKWKELEQELQLLKEQLDDANVELNELNDPPEEKIVEEDISEPEPEKIPILDNAIVQQTDAPIELVYPTTELNYLAYGSVHYAGVSITKSTNGGYDYNLTQNTRGFNGKCDLQVVVDDEEIVGSDGKPIIYNSRKNAEKIKDFVNRLLSLKSDILFNSKYNRRLSNYMTEEEYKQMKFYILAVPAEEFKDSFVGMSDLNKNDEKFSPDKGSEKFVFKIVARFKHDGILHEISLGNLSNPDTTEKSISDIINNAKDRLSKHPEESEYLTKFIESVKNGNYIRDYRDFLKDLISQKELEISKENLNFTNTKASLIKLPKKQTLKKFKIDNPHLVISPTYFYRRERAGINNEIRELLAQRAVVFLSPNTNLSPSELAKIWVEEQKEGKPHSVLMIRLQNRGLTFSDLENKDNKKSNRFVVETRNGTSYFPFETKIMSYRMLAALWNYRADLINFINQVKNRIDESGEFDSLEELDKAIKDYAISMQAKLTSGMSIEDAEQKTLQEDQRFQKIESINKAIDNQRFRLGSRSDADTIIRKIDTDFYGIFTTFANAEKMLSSIGLIFDQLNSFIKIERNGEIVAPSERIGDKNGRLVGDKKEKLTAQITSIYDTLEGTFDGQTFKFPAANDIRFIPLLLLKLYGRAGVYSSDPDKFNPDSFIFDFKVNGVEQALNLKDLITKGKEIQDLLNLCMFGTTEKLNSDTERASASYFKNGFYIDPMCSINSDGDADYLDGSFVQVGNSDYSFFIEYGVRFPRINFNPNGEIETKESRIDEIKTEEPIEEPVIVKSIVQPFNSYVKDVNESYFNKDSEQTIGEQIKQIFGEVENLNFDWKDNSNCYIRSSSQVIGKMNIDKGIIISALPEGKPLSELNRLNRLNILRYYEIDESEYKDEDWGELISGTLPFNDDFVINYFNNNCV